MKITLENGKEVTISKESYDALVKAANNDTIYTPDNIRFAQDIGDGDGLAIVFDDYCCFYTCGFKPRITGVESDFIVKTKLVKVDKPKAGNWYYVTDEDLVNEDFSRMSCYKKYISDEEYYYIAINDSSIQIVKSNWSWKNYYQVVVWQ